MRITESLELTCQELASKLKVNPRYLLGKRVTFLDNRELKNCRPSYNGKLMADLFIDNAIHLHNYLFELNSKIKIYSEKTFIDLKEIYANY